MSNKTNFDQQDYDLMDRILAAMSENGDVASVWKSDDQLSVRYITGFVVGHLMVELQKGNGEIDGAIASAFIMGRLSQIESWQDRVNLPTKE